MMHLEGMHLEFRIRETVEQLHLILDSYHWKHVYYRLTRALLKSKSDNRGPLLVRGG